MARGDPIRVRVAVRDRGAHVGYLTTVGYPDREITAFSSGLPYFEIIVSDLGGGHVALLQQFRLHWLVHCGDGYETAEVTGGLNTHQIMALAVLALRHRDRPAPERGAALKAHVEGALA